MGQWHGAHVFPCSVGKPQVCMYEIIWILETFHLACRVIKCMFLRHNPSLSFSTSKMHYKEGLVFENLTPDAKYSNHNSTHLDNQLKTSSTWPLRCDNYHTHFPPSRFCGHSVCISDTTAGPVPWSCITMATVFGTRKCLQRLCWELFGHTDFSLLQ